MDDHAVGRSGSGASAGPRVAWRIVLVMLLAWIVGFAAFYPDVVTVRDESAYVRQAVTYAEGRTHDVRRDPLTLETTSALPSEYPAGTALLMTPAVALLGWRGAFLVPALGLIGTVLLTGRWIERQGGSPLWAVTILGFPAALVMSRVAMSDAPSMLVAAVGLWAFWRGLEGSRGWWVLSGLVAGASITLRETNALVFVAFFLGAILRRDARAWILVAAGTLGASLRPLTAWLLFDDPLFVKTTSGFGLGGIAGTLVPYALALLVMIPGGLVAGLAYRGRRAPELRATVALFVVFYLFYQYSGAQSGLVKGLVLGPRFFLPLLPILAFALADVGPRLWRWIGRERPGLSRPVRYAVVVWLLGVGVAAFGVHPAMDAWADSRGAIVERLREHTDRESVIVTNELATDTYLSQLDLAWLPIDIARLDPETAERLVEQHGRFQVILLDRYDSEYWRDRSATNARVMAPLVDGAELVHDDGEDELERLRIWRLDSMGSGRP